MPSGSGTDIFAAPVYAARHVVARQTRASVALLKPVSPINEEQF